MRLAPILFYFFLASVFSYGAPQGAPNSDDNSVQVVSKLKLDFEQFYQDPNSTDPSSILRRIELAQKKSRSSFVSAELDLLKMICEFLEGKGKLGRDELAKGILRAPSSSLVPYAKVLISNEALNQNDYLTADSYLESLGNTGTSTFQKKSLVLQESIQFMRARSVELQGDSLTAKQLEKGLKIKGNSYLMKVLAGKPSKK